MTNSGYWSGDWETQGNNGVGGLSNERKARLQKGKDRANWDLYNLRAYKQKNPTVIPKIYFEHAKELVGRFNTSAKLSPLEKKNTEVTIAEETYVLDREKARVYYEQSIAAQIFQSVTRPLGKFKWDVKQYAINKVANAVKYSQDFNKPRYIQLKTTNQFDHGMGRYVGYQIDRFKILENEGELFDLQYETMLEASTQLARATNRWLFTGGTNDLSLKIDDGEAGANIDMTGFVNNTNNQSFSIATPTTYGNILKGFKSGLSDLKKVYATNNVKLLISAGIPDQAELNYPSYGNGNYTEWDEIKRTLIGPNKPIKEVWTSDLLTGAAISLSTQTAAFIKLDPRLMNRLMVLGLQTLPSMEKKYSDDISEVMLTADILRFNIRADTTLNPFNVTKVADLTTTNLGYRSEERIA